MLIPQHVVFYLYQESCKLRAHVRLIIVYPEQKQVVVPVKHVSSYQGSQGGRAACLLLRFFPNPSPSPSSPRRISANELAIALHCIAFASHFETLRMGPPLFDAHYSIIFSGLSAV